MYASLPLSGPAGTLGRDLLRGAELELERRAPAEVELVALDAAGEDREAQAVANARRAVADPEALAHLGDFHSSQTLETSPILGAAGMLQVAPVATFVGLGGPTLVRLTPHDGVGARAIVDWLAARGAGEVLVVHDHDDGYGVPVAAMCVDAARSRGLTTRSRPVWDNAETIAAEVDDADAIVYVGVAGSGAIGLWHDLHTAAPRTWLIGSEGVAAAWLAEAIDAAAAERTRFFVPLRAPLAFYGYEAMALILDAIAAAGPERAAVARTARATRDRDSVLGRYSLDADGHTTSTAYGRLAVAGGELVWDREIGP